MELGADVHAADRYGNTPLHFAAGSSFNPQSVRSLLEYSADPLARDEQGRTPLEHALACASNINIENLVEIAEELLRAGTPVTPFMLENVARIGEGFEFHRGNFNPDSVEAVSGALARLYEIFRVPPVERRLMHNGTLPIVAPPGTLLKQHQALWKLLVPGQGPAQTVQGEVIRITGRVHDEIYRNGGGNWDADYKKMLDALLGHLASGAPLDAALLDEAAALAKRLRPAGDGDEEPARLCELAAAWVAANPKPVALGQPAYGR